jgi:hypothetical protein
MSYSTTPSLVNRSLQVPLSSEMNLGPLRAAFSAGPLKVSGRQDRTVQTLTTVTGLTDPLLTLSSLWLRLMIVVW